jgi:protein disulfide-isomerase
MKNLILIVALALTTNLVMAQADTYTAANPGWMVDPDKAYVASKKEGKPIMANFTGSDWCGWCKKLTATVFSTPEFKAWAKKNVILLELDFPRRFQIPAKYQQQNNQLRGSFKVAGYPTIWVFNLDKNAGNGQYQIDALGKTGYAPTVGEFTGAVDRMIKAKS